jgi:predicted ATPase
LGQSWRGSANCPHHSGAPLRAALLIEEPEGGPQDQRAIGVALHRVLLRLAEEAPVVVAVDDLQWLDRASRSVLEFAMRRLEAPVGLLASARPAAEFAFEAERLRLSALDVNALATLLRERIGLRLSRPTLLQVERASAGNPLYALELGRALLAHEGRSSRGSRCQCRRRSTSCLQIV